MPLGISGWCTFKPKSVSRSTELTLPFRYDAAHKVIVCLFHGYAIQKGPDSVYSHLKHQHTEKCVKSRAELQAYQSQLDLLAMGDVEIPREPIEPVEGLEILLGFKCRGCRYVCGTKDSMEKHVRQCVAPPPPPPKLLFFGNARRKVKNR
ncbi:hypothetical protein EDC01DRAFT_446116 [Geopyxis carbonaria]|nr:hypothetical protein EDC01DRAFT_446116 [Geopyxis carbonaria]